MAVKTYPYVLQEGDGTGHMKDVCECGAVQDQCRCPSQTKRITVVCSRCNKCSPENAHKYEIRVDRERNKPKKTKEEIQYLLVNEMEAVAFWTGRTEARFEYYTQYCPIWNISSVDLSAASLSLIHQNVITMTDDRNIMLGPNITTWLASYKIKHDIST